MPSQLTIDDRPIAFQDGQTVLEAARRSGIRIPALCYHRKTGCAGRCRICVVEVEGQRGLSASCLLPARNGMVVRTATSEVLEARRMVVNLMLSNGEHNCLACEKNGECELQDAAYELGIEVPKFVIRGAPPRVDDSSEMIVMDGRKCIQCGRCVAGCHDVVVNEVLGVGGRGFDARIVCDDDRPMADSTCVQCGECRQLCPVGAIVDKKAVGKGRGWDLEKVNTTCPYCGVGCQVTLHVDRARNRIAKVTGREVPPNDGMLCVKGRYGYEFPSSSRRLTKPLLKRNGKHEEVSWDEALDYIAGRVKEITAKHGPDVFSAFGSGRITNENNYAISKFTRAVIKTNNVDHCARTCHAPTVAGLAAAFGSGAMTNSIREIEDAKCIFVIGSNMTEAHPVVSYYVKRAVRKGAILIVNDPRRTDLCRWATLHAQHKVGSDVAYINGLINEIFRNGWADETFLKEHTENPDEIRKAVEAYPVEKASEICGVPVETLKKVARILGTQGPASVCYTLGITEHICGTDNVKAIANLQMVLGNLGKYATGVNPLRGQNNVQGACDVGALPDVYHGYQSSVDPKVLKKMEKAWGVTGLSNRMGYKMPTMLRKALDGGTKILYGIGDNTVQTEPNMAHTIKELQALELFVCCDIFPNMTTPYAHVILPDYAWGEEDGTFTNTERRVQRVRRALTPPGEARPSWWMLQELGKRLGVDLGFTSAKAVWEDMRRSATSYAGITWERIDHVGLQWPCPTLEHPGTSFLHQDGHFTRGKGLFSRTDWIPPAEVPDREYPLVLSTGRRLWHYHTRTQTRNCEGLEHLFPEELLEMNPVDASALSIKSGDFVTAISRRGQIRLRAWVTERAGRGMCWTAFHFEEACANVLTKDAYDSVTETPEFKACAIRVEKLSDGPPLPSALIRQARP